MNDSILTLPGDIPGLLRRGSPVWRARAVGGLRCVCLTGAEGTAAVVLAARSDKCTEWYKSTELVLDLSDPTGRAHAAWWVLGQSAGPVSKALAALDTSSTYLLGLIDRCCAGSATAFDTEALRRIVLHVAGRPVI